MLQPLDFDLLNELIEISVILHTQKIVDDSGSIAVPLLFHGYSSLLYLGIVIFAFAKTGGTNRLILAKSVRRVVGTGLSWIEVR